MKQIKYNYVYSRFKFIKNQQQINNENIRIYSDDLDLEYFFK